MNVFFCELVVMSGLLWAILFWKGIETYTFQVETHKTRSRVDLDAETMSRDSKETKKIGNIFESSEPNMLRILTQRSVARYKITGGTYRHY